MDTIPNSVVVLLVILAAAAATCMGYAVHRLAFKQEPVNWNKKSAPQMEYMRELRERTRMQVYNEARGGRYRQDQDQSQYT